MLFEGYKIICLPNIFIYTGINLKTKQYNNFIISSWKDDGESLYEYLLNEQRTQVGFCNMQYDYLILHEFLSMKEQISHISSIQTAKLLYSKHESIMENKPEFIPDKDKIIKQIDLYRVAHLKNTGVSLNDIKFCLSQRDILSIEENYPYEEKDEDLLLKINKSNVDAICGFFYCLIGKSNNVYYKNNNQLLLRENIQKTFKINCINYPDTRIGESIFYKLYCSISNKKYEDIKDIKGTNRACIRLENCIPYYAKFKTKEFNYILNEFKQALVCTIEDEFNPSIIINNIKLYYGFGGLHASIKSGIYKSNNDYIIIDQDCTSLYPSLCSLLKIYPEQYGESFYKVIKEMLNFRIKEMCKKEEERNYTVIESFKKSMNTVLGKMGSQESSFYDLFAFFKLTIAGQMLTSLWIENLKTSIDDIQFLSVNTDGICYMIKKTDFEKVISISDNITKDFNINITTQQYKQLIIKDVNNYIAESFDGDLKLKGCFEIEKPFNKDTALRIIPIALKEYFINGKDISNTIKTHKNIYDFCLKIKTPKDSQLFFVQMNKNGEFKETYLNKFNRYFISNDINSGIIKKYSNGRSSVLTQGYSCILFNESFDSDNYKIDYNYYIREANKIKDSIVDLQLNLFEYYVD